MINLRVRSRAATIIGTSLVAAASAILWAAAPAGASTNAAQNANIIGGGWATTYNLMQGVDTLYNSALGCNLITISSVPQPLDYLFPTTADTSAPPTVGSFGNYPAYSSTDTSQDGYTENPANDISVQEPPYGSATASRLWKPRELGPPPRPPRRPLSRDSLGRHEHSQAPTAKASTSWRTPSTG